MPLVTASFWHMAGTRVPAGDRPRAPRSFRPQTNSTKPFTWADVDLGIPGWSTTPQAVQIAVVLAIVVWLALPIPVLVAGFVRLRGWRPGNWFRAVAWAGGWIAGFALMRQAVGPWGTCQRAPAALVTLYPTLAALPW